MYKRSIYWISIVAVLCAGGVTQAATFTDNFDAAHDYLTQGVQGTGWDGFIGKGVNETVSSLNASGGSARTVVHRLGQRTLPGTLDAPGPLPLQDDRG